MDSGNDGGTLGTTAGSDCCFCWHDMLAQNQQERYSLNLLYLSHSNQSTAVDQRREQVKESGAVEEKESVYDEVKPNCAETDISLKSNIAYTTVKHISVL